MFSQEKGEFGGFRLSCHCHIGLGISQHPLAACVVVLDSGGFLAQQDYDMILVVGVARQLF